MSRHHIPAKSPKHKCVVGWDRGMSTFFAVVTDVELEGKAEREAEGACVDPVVCWIGADRVGEVETAEGLAERLADYAEVAESVLSKLRRDKEEAELPGRAQRLGQSFINSLRGG